jgi:hypothetical protein
MQSAKEKIIGGFFSAIKIVLIFNNFASLIHSKKRVTIFPSPAGMSLTKLSLAGNSLIIPVQGEFG